MPLATSGKVLPSEGEKYAEKISEWGKYGDGTEGKRVEETETHKTHTHKYTPTHPHTQRTYRIKDLKAVSITHS